MEEEKARLMFSFLSFQAFMFVLSPISYLGWRVTRHGLMVLHVLSFDFLFPLVISTDGVLSFFFD